MLRLVNPFSVLKTLSGISHHNKYSILLALEENWFLRLVRVNQMECKPYPFNSDSKCRVLRDFCVQNDRCEIEPQRVLKKSHLDSKPDFDNNPITESKNTEIGIGNGRLKDMVFVNVSFNDGVMSELNYEIASDNTYDKFVINNSNIFGGCKEPIFLFPLMLFLLSFSVGHIGMILWTVQFHFKSEYWNRPSVGLVIGM